MEKNNIYIEEIVKKQRMYFAEGRTLAVGQRMEALKKLEQGILNCEQELYAALKKDLGKSRAESYMCEVGLTLSELRFAKSMCRNGAGRNGFLPHWHSFMPGALLYRNLTVWCSSCHRGIIRCFLRWNLSSVRWQQETVVY